MEGLLEAKHDSLLHSAKTQASIYMFENRSTTYVSIWTHQGPHPPIKTPVNFPDAKMKYCKPASFAMKKRRVNHRMLFSILPEGNQCWKCSLASMKRISFNNLFHRHILTQIFKIYKYIGVLQVTNIRFINSFINTLLSINWNTQRFPGPGNRLWRLLQTVQSR